MKKNGSKKGRSQSPSQHERGELDLGLPKRWLNREEAINEFFTPRTDSYPEPVQEQLFGTSSMTFAIIRPRTAFIAPQIRKAYDKDRIERIGESIATGEDGQLQNGAVAFLDKEHIDLYLHQMNDYFSSDVTIDDLMFHDEFGHYVITCFGHNRQLAVASANQKRSGHPDSGIGYFVKVFINPTFGRILGNQAIENIGEPPHIAERARSMVKFREYSAQEGNPQSVDEIAKRFGVDRDQVWRADKFMALHPAVQHYIEEDFLPYSGAIELIQLSKLYDESYILDLAHRLAHRNASTPQIIQEVKKRIAASKLTPSIRHLIEEGGLTLPQAVELAKIVSIVPEDELEELAVLCTAHRLEIDELRKRVSDLLEKKLSGAMTFFDQTELDPVQAEAIQAMRRTSIESHTRAHLQASMTEVTRHLSNLKSLYTSGLVGSAATGNPIAKGAPEFLGNVLESIFSVDGHLDVRSLQLAIEQLCNFKKANEHSSQFIAELDPILDQLDALLVLAQEETEETQAERKNRLARVVVSLARENSTQDSLF